MADARVGTTPYWFRFIDWPLRQGGTPKPAVIDTWLYIFQVHAKAASLQAEVFLQAAHVDEETGQKLPERYYPVDLKRHAGQNKRPYAEPVDACWLDDSSLHVLEKVRYYVLCSPFQLHWSRSKEIASTKDPKKFEELAAKQRGLSMTLLDPDHTKPGPGSRLRIKAIRTPWGDGQALSKQFQSKLRDWETRANTTERKQWRTLLAGIDMLSRGNRFKGLLDEDYLKNHVYATLLEDDRLFIEVEEAAKKLILHLRGPAMTAMELDAAATDDTDERGAFAAIRLMLEQRLEQTKAGREYRRDWYAEHENLVLFDVVANLKGLRKGAKAVWTWAKSWADVAAGYPAGSKRAGQVPVGFGLVTYAERQANAFAVTLAPKLEWSYDVAPEGTESVPTKRRPAQFSKESMGELKARVNENPKLTALFALVDAVNVFFTLRAVFDGDSKNDTDRTKNAASAASGLCSFLSSALSFARTKTLHLSGDELLRHMIVRQTDAVADALLSSYENQGAVRRGLAKASSSRLFMSGLGALGAAFDVVGSSADLVQGLHEAKTGDSPDRIWILPGLGIVGSAITILGYALLVSNPAGAVVLVLGAALGATATIANILSPAQVASEVEKWLMHSFVGKHRLSVIDEKETFTSGRDLEGYHKDLGLQIAGLNYVLFDFDPKCEIHEENGQPLLKVDVRFRQVRCHTKVELKVFGYQGGKWLMMFHSMDWRPPVAPPEDMQTHLRQEGFGRSAGNIPAAGFKRMKICLQLDVFGDRSFMYPEHPRQVECKA